MEKNSVFSENNEEILGYWDPEDPEDEDRAICVNCMDAECRASWEEAARDGEVIRITKGTLPNKDEYWLYCDGCRGRFPDAGMDI